MAGRKKLPDAVKKLKGTDQPCRLDGGMVAEYDKITKVPSAPTYLNADAKKVYFIAANQLAGRGVLDVVNINTVMMYACEMGKYIQAQKDIKKLPKIDFGEKLELYGAFEFSIDAKGRPKIARSAIDKLSSEYLDNARKLASELGITPASASKVKVAPKEEEDPFLKMLEGN